MKKLAILLALPISLTSSLKIVLTIVLTIALIISLTTALSHAPVKAQEIYKWTDENGKVHFSDRATAPADSKKVNIKVPPPNPTPPTSAGSDKLNPANIPARTAPPRPNSDGAKKSIPVDPSKVGPKCPGLIDQIAKVKRGTPWEALAKEFNEACPGITYECINYRSRPENNTCTWVERTGNDFLLTKNYP